MSQSSAGVRLISHDQGAASGSSKPTGTCPVCFTSGIRLTKAGLLYNHGRRDQQCAGFGGLPLSYPASSSSHSSGPPPTPHTSSVPLPSSTSSSSPPIHTTDGLVPPSIKWIPRGARAQCASLLTRLISEVVKSPDHITPWENLLAFGGVILQRPPRGGCHRNLGNILSRRCMNFSQLPRESSSAQVPTSRRDGFYNRKIDVKTQEMVNMGRVVTARLEEGNFKGAVSLITSPPPLHRKHCESCWRNIHLPQSTVDLLPPSHPPHLNLLSRNPLSEKLYYLSHRVLPAVPTV